MAELFWSATSGDENAQIEAFNSALGPVRMVARFVTSGDVLPPGDYENEPLVWNGTEWVPGATVVVGSVQSEPTSLLLVQGGEAGLQLNALGTGSVVMNGPGPGLTLSDSAANLNVASVQRLFLSVDATPVFDSDSAGISFLGKTPTVPRQAVSGSSMQAQLDSLVSGLVNYGLALDTRLAHPQPILFRFPNDTMGAKVFNAIPAAAPSGYYQITFSSMCRVAATGGTYNVGYTYTSRGGIACSIAAGNILGSPAGAVGGTTVRMVEFQTGTPLVVTCTPVAVTGSPDFDLFCLSEFILPTP